MAFGNGCFSATLIERPKSGLLEVFAYEKMGFIALP
jgi:hypothetical protein